LGINKLVRDGNIRPGQWRSGTLTWRRVPSGEEVGSIGYEANLIDPDDAWVRLHYRQNGEPRDYPRSPGDHPAELRRETVVVPMSGDWSPGRKTALSPGRGHFREPKGLRLGVPKPARAIS
jgi:hypothetical protein